MYRNVERHLKTFISFGQFGVGMGKNLIKKYTNKQIIWKNSNVFSSMSHVYWHGKEGVRQITCIKFCVFMYQCMLLSLCVYMCIIYIYLFVCVCAYLYINVWSFLLWSQNLILKCTSNEKSFCHLNLALEKNQWKRNDCLSSPAYNHSIHNLIQQKMLLQSW